MTIDLLAFGAHPDDAELGAAGTLIRAARGGSRTGIVTLTRGEMGTRGDASSRAAEFDEAAAAMGLAHHAMLDLPDGRLECTAASREAVVRELRGLRPAVVLAPYWEDRHPDHVAASRIAHPIFRSRTFAGSNCATSRPRLHALRWLSPSTSATSSIVGKN